MTVVTTSVTAGKVSFTAVIDTVITDTLLTRANNITLPEVALTRV